MIVHQEARRGQLLYVTTPSSGESTRKRLAGRRVNGRDDKGRSVMPFDLLVRDQGRVVRTSERRAGAADLMIAAFGGYAWR